MGSPPDKAERKDMANKKDSTPVLKVEPEEVSEEKALEQEAEAIAKMRAEMEAQQARLDALQKENEQLKKNSIYSSSPFGGAQDYERVHKACEEAAKAGEDPWEIKISVNAPRIGKGEESYWLCVNGRSIAVPANNRYYELALPFAQCLVDEIRNRYRAEDYADSIENYDPVTHPKTEQQ